MSLCTKRTKVSDKKDLNILMLDKDELSRVSGAQKLFEVLESRDLSNIFPSVRPQGIRCCNQVLGGDSCSQCSDCSACIRG